MQAKEFSLVRVVRGLRSEGRLQSSAYFGNQSRFTNEGQTAVGVVLFLSDRMCLQFSTPTIHNP